MQFKEWVIKRQKFLSLGIGALLMVWALGMLFWENSTTVSEDEAYAQRVAAMEARMGPSSASSVSPQSSESPIMKAYREKQAEHIRYTLIVMMVAGAGFLLYGLLKKKEK